MKNQESINCPPFITFHLGTLGYLAIYNIENYEEILLELSEKKNIFESRNLVSENIIDSNNNIREHVKALNEILIERGSDLKMISLAILQIIFILLKYHVMD